MAHRREVLKKLGLGACLVIGPQIVKSQESTQAESKFVYCLNTSTISGQQLGLKANIEIAARAGYDGVELWIRDIQEYLEAGNSIHSLKRLLSDSKLTFENAIGFAPWMVDDEQRRNEGMQQMAAEMELLASLGCKRVAAPAAGVDAPLDLFRAGERYRELLELGRKTGVMPQLEFWGAFPYFHHIGQALMVAAVAGDSDARILPDVYHLFRGNSSFDALDLLNGEAIEVFHFNDYPGDIDREMQEDKDRVFPGDGVAPWPKISKTLKSMAGSKVLSLELFNRSYWQMDALEVAKTGLEKMKRLMA